MKAIEQHSPVSGKAAKHAAGTKRGKTCSWCRARENMQLVSSAGKHAAGAERGISRLVLEDEAGPSPTNVLLGVFSAYTLGLTRSNGFSLI